MVATVELAATDRAATGATVAPAMEVAVVVNMATTVVGTAMAMVVTQGVTIITTMVTTLKLTAWAVWSIAVLQAARLVDVGVITGALFVALLIINWRRIK